MPAKERTWTNIDEINHVRGLGTFRLSRIELSPQERKCWLLQYIAAHKDSPHVHHQAAIDYIRDVIGTNRLDMPPVPRVKPEKPPEKKAGVIGPGYCQCGCGQMTNIARCSDSKRGWVKGEPMNYVKGHHGPNKKGPEGPG